MLPFFLFNLIYRNRLKIAMRDKQFFKDYGFLFDKVKLTRTWYSKYYVPIVFWRGLILVMLPVIFNGKIYF